MLQDLLARGMKNCNIIRPARPLAERTPNFMPQRPPAAKRGAEALEAVTRLAY